MTRAIDPTRPVVTASGGDWSTQDIVAMHAYQQDPEKFAQQLDDRCGSAEHTNVAAAARAAADHPLVMDEFGGTRWNPDQAPDPKRAASWGYGQDPTSADEFHDRVQRLTHAIVDRPDWSGYCYTQLTDVEQEQNGLYFYDRSPKFDMTRVRETFARKPEWSRW